MEESNNVFRVWSVDNQLVLAFFNTRVDVTNEKSKPSWKVFPATRTAPGEYVTSTGKTGKFREKLLTEDEAKSYKPAPRPVKTAAKSELPFVVCDASRKLKDELVEYGVSERKIVEILKEKFPLKKAEKPEKKSMLDF